MAESGVALAIVVENKDDSGTGRVKVRFPGQAESHETRWARVATPMTGNGYGTFFIPEVGDEVLVAFERGDLRFPYVIGSLWNGRNKAPLENADGQNDVRLIRTRKGHTLTFDDGARGRVQLELNDGKRLSIEGGSVTLQDGDGNGLTIESGSGAVTIRSTGRLTLKGSEISIEASGAMDIKASATLTIQGSLVRIN
jgi:uncharacterized protein involved in type VI secretion and phage assembly